MEKHPLHIKHPDLQTSPEVNRAVEREERKTGEKIPNDPSERIEAYMDRLENIFLNPDEGTRERNLELFRPKIHDALLIKPENFPESYFDLQMRVARERGEAVEHIPVEARQQMIDVAIADQRASLDAWIDYLSSEDAVYPPWFKFYVWRNITKLSQFDKERGEFKKRTSSTVAPFPDIYREPLAQIADLYEQVKEDNKSLSDEEVKAQFSKKFPTLYAELIQKTLEQQAERGEDTQGQWIKYNQGEAGAAEQLFQSLEGQGTGWCTAGRSTAETQIESGDFYVYYTNDQQGQPTQPRLAIRMNGQQQIGEVRGVLPQQNVEPIMQEVLDTKLNEFGSEADSYRKKSSDMKRLTEIELKVFPDRDPKKKATEQLLTKEDLLFLYEIEQPIEGFGYQKDPRIQELRQDRDTQQDMLVIFECTREQIANIPSQINETTKAYVGPLEPGIFTKLQQHNIEHIFTQFPERPIRREQLEVGGKTGQEYITELEAKGVKLSQYAKDMLLHPDFEQRRNQNPETENLIRLTIADLGFTSGATTEQIFERAEELGLTLCPPDTGPSYRLNYKDQPLDEWVRIGMETITDPSGNPYVFDVGRSEEGLWLDNRWAGPDGHWIPYYKFMFRLGPSTKA